MKRFFSHGIKRNPKFATISTKHLSLFESLLGKNHVVVDQEILKVHNSDWTKKYHGQSKLMLKPGSAEEVSAVLKICNEEKLAVVPQSGNTGLVGGSQPIHDEIILQMGRMNKIEAFDEE